MTEDVKEEITNLDVLSACDSTDNLDKLEAEKVVSNTITIQCLDDPSPTLLKQINFS